MIRATLVFMVLLAAGCVQHRAPAPRYESVAVDPNRDTDRAKRHNQRGVDLIERGQLDEARRELETALAADPFFGPAHNNLGNVYCLKKDFYRAAWELQMAAKLMPDQAKPRNNLGAVYEAVGKLQDAKGAYEEARRLDPREVSVAGSLARVRVRLGLRDQATRELLLEVIAKDVRPEWVRWARQELARTPSDTSTSRPSSRPQPRGPIAPR